MRKKLITTIYIFINILALILYINHKSKLFLLTIPATILSLAYVWSEEGDEHEHEKD